MSGRGGHESPLAADSGGDSAARLSQAEEALFADAADLTLDVEDVPPQFVDWFSITRSQGRPFDAGMHRHWVDPTIPFAREVLARSHGAVITSATLRDHTQPDLDDDEDDEQDTWLAAEVRTGTQHFVGIGQIGLLRQGVAGRGRAGPEPVGSGPLRSAHQRVARAAAWLRERSDRLS